MIICRVHSEITIIQKFVDISFIQIGRKNVWSFLHFRTTPFFYFIYFLLVACGNPIANRVAHHSRWRRKLRRERERARNQNDLD